MKFRSYLVLLILVCTNCIAQTTVVLEPSIDNTMYSENGNLSNATGVNLFAGSTASGNKRRSLIQFNLSSIPAGATITEVSLMLTVNNIAPASGNLGVNLHKVSSAWGEGTSLNNPQGTGSPATANDATWTHRLFSTNTWTLPGGDFLAASGGTAISSTGPVVISSAGLATDVTGWLNNPATNFGWAIVGNAENSTSSARRFASRSNINIADRPKLSITYTGSLPVVLKSFTAALQQQNVVLSWKTGSEINSDYFNVEHSTNGQTFTFLSRQKSAGNSSVDVPYQFVHRGAPKGRQFYRLAQFDKDGTRRYSPIISVSKTSGITIKVLPNPATEFLVLSGDAVQASTRYVIKSENGQLLMSGNYNNRPISIKGLPAGTLAITIFQSNGISETTLIIKK